MLANAKSGGADNKQVFNFLSDPITTKVTEGKTQATSHISIIPLLYDLVVIGYFFFVIAMTIGRFVKDRQEREETDLFDNEKVGLETSKFLTDNHNSCCWFDFVFRSYNESSNSS